ncbi:unnamed protein product [Cylindrotheca closterium]|uniref:BZIP domain-containing protein n=1 Tax=Cylindrotheca closterium TaxID=2856 RepID=A0AAD2D136_9STRA|nr:unnamed protein product [Cylindrotheca closterium]
MAPYNHEKSGKQDSSSSPQPSSSVDSRSSMTQQDTFSAASVSPIPMHNPSPAELRYNPHPLHTSARTQNSAEASAAPVNSQQQCPDWTMSEAMPNSSNGLLQMGNSVSRPAIQNKENTKKERQIAPTKKRQSAKVQQDRPKGAAVTGRRQKRLERNRESARLSRRRRKQYLEVLEERVTQLSIEMDQGRREHAGAAMETVIKKRNAIFKAEAPIEELIAKLDGGLNRTSSELTVLSTFYIQQLKSLALSPHSKFILWLTLQGDSYFRGGRAASERLSAARIGERMLLGGNDKVTPINSMWPLVCNEIGLSYDQEERVRNFQRTLLQTPTTWLDRHTSRAAGLAVEAFDSSLKAATQSIRKREQVVAKQLTPKQRLNFARWAELNSDRMKTLLKTKRDRLANEKNGKEFEVSITQHTSANLYILNHRLRKVIGTLPQNLISFNSATLKRLSRRPSFESLGQQKDDDGNLTREGSFASSGSLKSLKRSSSSLSIDDPDRPQCHQIHPEDGQREAEPLVKQELGFVQRIIPSSVLSNPASNAVPIALPPTSFHGYSKPYMTSNAATAENLFSDSRYQHDRTMQYPSTIPSLPISAGIHTPQYGTASTQQQPLFQHVQQTQPAAANATASQQNQQADNAQQEMQSRPAKVHKRKTSFLPAHLGAVPEEEFNPGDGGAEDFFMSLIDDEDWAIGEGVDMDPTA